MPRGFACFGYAESASDLERPVPLLAEAQAPGFGWAEYQFELRDLEGFSRLELHSSSGSTLSIRISPPGPPEPRLIGGIIPPRYVSSEAGLPLYTGLPPILELPLVDPEDPAGDLARWGLTIRAMGSAEPQANVHFPLTALKDLMRLKDRVVHIPLASDRLLGDGPTGEFSIVMRGPLGHDARFRLRILPVLYVETEQPLWIAGEDTGQSGPTLRFSLPKGSRLTL